MKLEKAIEVNQAFLMDEPQFPPEDRREAVKLGIEALKLVEMERRDHLSYAGELLPGETEK